MGKPEPLDMQAILDQQVKLAASMERLQEAIGPLADAIRRGMTYDLVRNKRVQITANDRVEMYAGKDAEAIAIRVDHNLAAGDFTYWVGGRAYTALSYAYNHSNATPDEIVIPLDERGDKIEFSSTVTGVLTYTGLTLQQALPKMLTQLAVVRAVGIVGAGATPADPVYSELTGSSAPLTAGTPVLVDTIAYGTFTASSVLLRKYSGVLHRNARTRLISVVSTIDQNFSSNPTFVMTDSSYLATNGYWGKGAMYNGGAGSPFNVITNNMASNHYNFFAASSTDDVTPDAVAYPADGFSLALPMGATLPIQGNVYVYVEEVF